MLMQQWWLYRMMIDLHKELAVKCLQAGQKHALLKKPVAQTHTWVVQILQQVITPTQLIEENLIYSWARSETLQWLN